jgi:hypothetical protein
MKFLPACLLAFLSSSVFGQKMAALDQGLLAKFHRIDYWLSYDSQDSTVDKYDSLDKANIAFRKALLQVTNTYPASMSYDFPLLRDSARVRITTAKDGKLRIYSWNTLTGGSMLIFDNIIQYKTVKGVHSSPQPGLAEDGEVGWCTGLYPLKAGNKTYYLILERSITCGVCRVESAKAYTIGSNALIGPIKIFKTEAKLENQISLEFREFDRGTTTWFLPHVIHYNSAKHELSLPTGTDEMNGMPNDQLVTYHWTGAYFSK